MVREKQITNYMVTVDINKYKMGIIRFVIRYRPKSLGGTPKTYTIVIG